MKHSETFGSGFFSEEDVEKLKANYRPQMQRQIEELAAERDLLIAAQTQRAIDLLTERGFAPSKGESVEAALSRYESHITERSAQIDADLAAQTAALESDSAPIRDEITAIKSELSDRQIIDTLMRVATESEAYAPDQLVSIMRPRARRLANGEIVVDGIVPTAMQSVDEVIDYLRIDQPNLFAARRQR